MNMFATQSNSKKPLLEPTPPPATQTVNACTVIHEAKCYWFYFMLTTLDGVAQADTLNPVPSIRDPPVPQQKGRPQTVRLTFAIEGPRRGGGRSKQPYPGAPALQSQPSLLESNPVMNSPPHLRRRQNHCGLCGEAGHDCWCCYDVHMERQEHQEH
ncbi:hypothetical protein K439DRAFT_1521362 [Ramaria rubella]|nr:hypothetical protein K439DRAFT_1521362 [Ramaria rubella]